MAVVTSTDAFGINIVYFNGEDQLIPYRGYSVEGQAPYVPEDNAPGWVCFEVEQPTGTSFQDASSDLARRLFMDLGFTAEQVMTLMEDF